MTLLLSTWMDRMRAFLETGGWVHTQPQLESSLFQSRSVFESRCQAAAVGEAASAENPDGPWSTSTIFGGMTCFIPRGDSEIGIWLAKSGYWEAWVTVAVGRWLSKHPRARVFNLGANSGYYTMLAGGLGAEVVGVEANSALVTQLKATAAANRLGKSVSIRHAAVWSRPGELLALGRPHPSSFNCFVNRPDWHDVLEQVETVTVDSLVKEMRWKQLDMIIADIEGCEEDILDGMTKTLADNPKLVYVTEWNTTRYDNPRDFARRTADVGRWPLRKVNFAGDIVPVTVEELLASTDDETLWLCREDS